MLTPPLLRFAASIIRETSAQSPVDRVLRARLKADRDLTPSDRREVALAVFNYYRWLGWVGKNENLRDEIEWALELADRFKSDPKSISNDELIAKAVPGWVHDHAKLSVETLRQFQSEPVLWLRCKSGELENVITELGDCVAHPNVPNALEYRGDKDLFHTQSFKSGLFEIQDISSQIVGHTCAPKQNENWWDVCAGEGGKLLHLSDLKRNKGLIWATDPAAWRLKKLRTRAARSKAFNYQSGNWQPGQAFPFSCKFDGILVDAPCSGVGTWQRNPQARWTTLPKDVEELATIQSKLLEAVCAKVRAGGKLVYSVCTLSEIETNQIADTFEQQHPEFEPSNRQWLLPHEVRGNGMFIVAWKRKKS